MSNELTVSSEIISSLVLKGDMSGLSPNQKVQYVMNMCDRLGLDPLTQPFKILKLQGKEVLYADKGCAQQLCKIYKISTEVTKREKVEDIYIVTVRASGADGRFTDEDGAVTIGSSKGDTLANAMMKAVTKAKRRAVLAYCGLGLLDETEVDTIKGAVKSDINIIEHKSEPYLHDTIQTVLTQSEKEPMPVELEEFMDLAMKVFNKKKINFLRWLGSTFQTNEPEKLTKDQLIKGKELLNDLTLIDWKEGDPK